MNLKFFFLSWHFKIRHITLALLFCKIWPLFRYILRLHFCFTLTKSLSLFKSYLTWNVLLFYTAVSYFTIQHRISQQRCPFWHLLFHICNMSLKRNFISWQFTLSSTFMRPFLYSGLLQCFWNYIIKILAIYMHISILASGLVKSHPKGQNWPCLRGQSIFYRHVHEIFV